MTLDTSKLDARVALFRAKNPNIAGAFDETKALLSQIDSRLSVLEAASAPKPPPPPPAALPFAEPPLTSPIRMTIPVSQTQVTLDPAKDYEIDLQWLERGTSVLFFGGRNVVIRNGYWNITKPIDGSPYWRGGPRVRGDAGHVHFDGLLVKGPSVADAVAVAAAATTVVTIQRARLESAVQTTGKDTPEPAEHCDAIQVQGKVGTLNVGASTIFAAGVVAPNDGGKCFQLKREDANGPFAVNVKSVNMRGKGRTGTFLLQTTRDIAVTLEDVWAADDGITSGWTWNQPGGGLFYPNQSVGAAVSWAVSGTAPSRVAQWPAGAGITGQIREGVPASGDFVSRATLGF